MKFSISNDLEYKALPVVFFFLSLTGSWCPSDWNPLAKSMYGFFSAYQRILGFTLWLTIVLNVIITNVESENLFDNIFGATVMSFGLFKQSLISKKRETIKKWIKTYFYDQWFEPRDQLEVEISQSYESEIRFSKNIILCTTYIFIVYNPFKKILC